MGIWQPPPWTITHALPVSSCHRVSRTVIRALPELAQGSFFPCDSACFTRESGLRRRGQRGLLLGLGQHSGELRCGTRAPGFESWFGGSKRGGAATRMSRANEWPSPLSGKVVLSARDPAASGGAGGMHMDR